jgi:hypothetical protein
VDRHGQVRAPLAAAFLARVGGQGDIAGLERCFPLPVLAVEAPVSVFTAFHGL